MRKKLKEKNTWYKKTSKGEEKEQIGQTSIDTNKRNGNKKPIHRDPKHVKIKTSLLHGQNAKQHPRVPD